MVTALPALASAAPERSADHRWHVCTPTYTASGIVVLFGQLPLGVMLDLLHHQYRYTYLLSFGLDGVGLVLLMILFQKFRAHGGPDNYVAPE